MQDISNASSSNSNNTPPFKFTCLGYINTLDGKKIFIYATTSPCITAKHEDCTGYYLNKSAQSGLKCVCRCHSKVSDVSFNQKEEQQQSHHSTINRLHLASTVDSVNDSKTASKEAQNTACSIKSTLQHASIETGTPSKLKEKDSIKVQIKEPNYISQKQGLDILSDLCACNHHKYSHRQRSCDECSNCVGFTPRPLLE